MRVLLIEDDRRLVRILTVGLRAEGYTVFAAYDGVEGNLQVERLQPDLIVLDLMLPERDGLEVLRELRARGTRTPVLLLTARDAVSDRVRGLDAGADDYLTKPFAFEELLARLRAIRRRRDPDDAPATLEWGRISMDREEHRVYIDGRSVELTPTEFSLLEFFMVNPRRVLSREQILSRVWGYEVEVESNAVEQYVHYLRSKLGDALPLTTVRGLGYRLDPDPAR